MLFNSVSLLLLCFGLCYGTNTTTKNVTVYDRYTGKEASQTLLATFNSLKVTSTCTLNITTCDETERRRVDGSCNSMTHPAKGTYFVPVRRVLPAQYTNDTYSRKAADGSDLQLPRVIRNTLLCEGSTTNLNFTQAMPGYGIFTFGDTGSIHDILYFLRNKTNCCTEEGKNDYECRPNIIPEDDPVHRFSGIRCMNLTKPLIYSDYKCTNDTKASPVERATAAFDMSMIYNAKGQGDSLIRSYEGGQLTVDVDENGIVWPPNGDNYCAANQPGETRCFGNYPTALLSGMLLSIWYMRNHNYFASNLAAQNPCWDDQTLFDNAREMNIAFAMQVYHYEWLPAVIGWDNLLQAGVITDDPGYRNIYNSSTYPETSLEYTYVLRWFHTAQDAKANFYDEDGIFIKSYPYTNITFRPGFLSVDKNIIPLTKHMFMQPTAKIDYGTDPELSEAGLPYLQQSTDILTSDLHKSRLLGFPPYIDYVNFCTGHTITCFEDLEEHMEKERIEQMKLVYTVPSDIDLLAGLWAEKIIDGGSIPATLACLIIEYINRAIRSDRHWYESSDRPHAFTEDQLAEIRKATLSMLICNNGDSVSKIQPNAFFNINTETNPLTACSDLPCIDFSPWYDETCEDYTTVNTSDFTSTDTDVSASEADSSSDTSS